MRTPSLIPTRSMFATTRSPNGKLSSRSAGKSRTIALTCSLNTTAWSTECGAAPPASRNLGTGLVDAMREHGLDPISAGLDGKETERAYIRDYGVTAPGRRARQPPASTVTAAPRTCARTAANSSAYPLSHARQEEHAARIIEYCWADVRGTYKLALRMFADWTSHLATKRCGADVIKNPPHSLNTTESRSTSSATTRSSSIAQS